MTEPKRQDVPGGGRLAMRLFLLSLGILFAGAMAGYLIVRSRATAWVPAGAPSLPSGLWFSTLLILVSSGTVEGALRSIRRGGQAGLRRGLTLTLILGAGFLVNQSLNWSGLSSAGLAAASSLFAFTFYMLTGLHAAHVIGGLVGLAIVTSRACRNRYGADHHPGVQYLQMYWHFLTVVWLVMFLLLSVLS